jgi:predicted phage terminase large subunit-like protein
MMEKYPTTRAVLIEDAANGPAVVSALHHEVRGVIPVTPEGGKFSRACAVQPQIEAGQVFLPAPRYPDGTLRVEHAWVEDFVEQCSLFPRGEHDDDVDALTQLLVHWQRRPGGLSTSEVLALMQSDDDDDDGGDDGRGPLKIPRCF